MRDSAFQVWLAKSSAHICDRAGPHRAAARAAGVDAADPAGHPVHCTVSVEPEDDVWSSDRFFASAGLAVDAAASLSLRRGGAGRTKTNRE
jgi:hypothetical protein